MASKKPRYNSECHVCNGPHNEADHQRSLDLHAWHRDEMLARIEKPPVPAKAKVGKPGFGRSPLMIDEDATRRLADPETL